MRGVLVSVSASLLFAGLYFITPLLAPLSAEALWAVRVIFTVPMLAALFAGSHQWHLFTDIGRRLRQRPILILPLLLSSMLLAVQLWVFGWAPLNGRGLNVALGYFLLPLVLVVVGRVLYRDRLAWWQWAAAGIAAVGVAFEVVRVGGVSWETLVVCLLYPVYFVLRRALGTEHLGGMMWDQVLLLPVALVVAVHALVFTPVLQEGPALWWWLPVYAVGSTLALVLYLTASRLLSLSMFGLLSYLEPALLMVAALLNGETISGEELVMYLAIWAAVGVIVLGGAWQIARGRRGSSGRGPAAS